MKYQEVINFWFKEISPKQMWGKDEEFDDLIKEKFETTYLKAIHGELFSWRDAPEGRLAEIIVLDQFSRNMYRNHPNSFKYDSLALILSQEAVRLKAHLEITESYRSFLIMPYMHSESKEIHEVALQLFSDPDFHGSLEFEIKHKKIIDTFRRYPHRNSILGRKSTEKELEFLQGPDSSF